jgi:uncharacterized protein DUF3300
MKPSESRRFYRPLINRLFAVSCSAIMLSLGQPLAIAQQAQSPATTTAAPATEAPKISNDQLDSLVAPIALYPDPLLANILAASTYPLEVIQMQQWMAQNKNLKDKALADAVAKQSWDPSVQSLASTPEVVQRLAGNIQWTTDLGNAFLSQQSDVMDAVQRMRAKADNKGTLKTSDEAKVEKKTENGKQVIVVEQADPQVVYVPSYDPTVVYGEPAYPYYPYSYPGWYAGMGLAWGAGIAWGAAWWGNHWGDCDWGHGDVNINNNNNFNRNNWNNANRPGGGNRPGAGNRPSQLPTNGGKWQHNPGHRGNAPYGDRRTADKFGGDARHTARDTRVSGGTAAGNRPGDGAGVATRPSGGAGAGTRPGGGAGVATRPVGGAGAGARPGGGGAATRPATRPSGGAGAARPNGGAASARPATRPAGGGGDRIGGYSPSRGGGGGAFGGGSANFARASSSRGGSSMGGGGFSRGGGGGGGRGGGGRGGGGGRRR